MRSGQALPTDLMDRLLAADESAAMDLIFSSVDDALYFGHDAQSWPDIEAFLQDPRWSELSLVCMIGGLSITLPIREKIVESRRVLAKLVEAHPEAEGRSDRLLRGLFDLDG